MLGRAFSAFVIVTAILAGGCGGKFRRGTPNEPVPIEPVLTGLEVTWDASGVIHPDQNAFSIDGAWYYADDCESAATVGLPCTEPDPALVGPDGRPGWSVSEDQVCARGIATQVVSHRTENGGMPAYAEQWGAKIGFTLAGAPGSADQASWDATAYGITGFQMSITGTRPPTVRVYFNTVDAAGHFVTVALPVDDELPIYFEQRIQDGPPPWVPNALTAIEVALFTNSTSVNPFDFCVSNLSVLHDPAF